MVYLVYRIIYVCMPTSNKHKGELYEIIESHCTLDPTKIFFCDYNCK